MQDFVHLHLHSEYSLLDGACRISQIPKMAKKMGHTAVAITDHGVLYGAVEFFHACEEEGIHPVIGCEVYVAPRSRTLKEGKADASGYHLVLLVENETGYRNLIDMVSRSFTEGFYSRPRIDWDLLQEHSEGLIALSACLAGKVPQLILAGRYEEARAEAVKMASLFGKDRYYLEIQDHGLPDEKVVVRALRNLSAETGIPLVATNDVHYLRQEDAYAQAVLMCIQTNQVITDGRPIGFETDNFYYRSTEEMEELFADVPQAISNTAVIARRCTFSFTFGQFHLPVYRTENGAPLKVELRRLAEEGLQHRRETGRLSPTLAPQAYTERLEYELSVIDRMGFNGYFLIVRDFVHYAKTHDIPVGPGRGSGAGSLVAYCVEITDVDPLRYDLLFERFLNPDRISMPDFDIDFCYEKRDRVIEYVRRRYGEEHVAGIITFGTLAARAAVRDVGRALGVSYQEVDTVAKLIPSEHGVSLRAAMQQDALAELYKTDPAVKKLLDIASQLEGMPRHASTHAAGIVITEKPVSEHVPIAVSSGAAVTQYDMNTVAELGLVKFDFLGLRYLTILHDAQAGVREVVPDFDLSALPNDDSATYRMLSAGQTSGIFQLESAGIRQVLTRLRPERFEDIIAAIALYRPGPMDSIDTFIARKHGKEPVTYPHPALEKILSVTYGCMVYQEQVMQIFRELAGYSYAKADLVRRAMSKKKESVLKAERDNFIAGAEKRGVPVETAQSIFDDIESFAHYAFNKSHATAYAVLCYRSAYLKCHYPRQYMAALMTSVLTNTGKLASYISECSKYGIRVLPPDINESRMEFSVHGQNIRFGLLAIKNVGRQFLEGILTERQKGPFRSFEDFIARTSGIDRNRRQVEALIKCGVFDSFGIYRSRLMAAYEPLISDELSRTRGNIDGQMDIFSMSAGTQQKQQFAYPEIPEYPKNEMLNYEKEVAGMYFSGHLLDDYARNIAALDTVPISEILTDDENEEPRFPDKQKVTVAGLISSVTRKNTRSGDPMAFLTLEDRYSEMEVIVFPKAAVRYARYLKSGQAVAVSGEVSLREGEPAKLILSSLTPIQPDSAPQKNDSSCKLYLKVPSLDHPLTGQALTLLREHAGGVPVYFYAADTGRYSLAKGVGCTPGQKLLAQLRELLGENSIALKS